MALVEQAEMIVDKWYIHVQLAAVWPVYSVSSFFIFLFNLESTNHTELFMMLASLSLIHLLNKGGMNGTNS